jgi:hypothetical protein
LGRRLQAMIPLNSRPRWFDDLRPELWWVGDRAVVRLPRSLATSAAHFLTILSSTTAYTGGFTTWGIPIPIRLATSLRAAPRDASRISRGRRTVKSSDDPTQRIAVIPAAQPLSQLRYAIPASDNGRIEAMVVPRPVFRSGGVLMPGALVHFRYAGTRPAQRATVCRQMRRRVDE